VTTKGEVVTRIRLEANISKTSGDATIADYYSLQSAIKTAWLLVLSIADVWIEI